MIKKSEQADYYYVMLSSCDASLLKILLHPDGEYIWLQNHMPEPCVQWWNTDIPISPGDVLSNARVRSVSYELELSLDFFIKNLPRFENHGLDLTQLSRPVPNGFRSTSLPAERRQHILLQNGMLTQLELPHAGEIAQFSCSDYEHLKSVTENPEIKKRLMRWEF